MADYLDKKQDVISFELTKYGRGLLGQGKLRPAHVCFFDDDIIYDLAYVGLNEEQNASKGRIIYDTPTFRSFNNVKNILQYPLGKSATWTDNAPTWDIAVLRGEQMLIEASSSYHKKVFEVSPLTYHVSLKNNNILSLQGGAPSGFELDNGKTIHIQDDYLLLQISENNNDDDFANFEIEIAEEADISVGISEANLNFIDKPTNIIDGYIYDEEELPSRFRNINLKKSDVSYYLDVLVDDEIDAQLIEPAAKAVEEQIRATYRNTYSGPVKEDC